MRKTNVDILLPTYNGEKYIRQQLDSILQQSDSGWKLYIRDDGSKDRTVEILREYQMKLPEQIFLITDEKGNLGITRNVFELLLYSTGDYIMFCDQDDVWFKNKVEKSKNLIQIKEKQKPNIPILVHTEALIVDENLNPIAGTIEYDQNEEISSALLQKYKASLMNQCGYHKYRTSFANLLLLNSVQGATVIMNKLVKEKLDVLRNTKIRKNLVHDSIIASVVSIFGEIYFYKYPLMYYRQHEKNAVGINRNNWMNWFSMSEEEKTRIKGSNFLLVNGGKWELIRSKYGKFLTKRQSDILYLYMREPNNWVQFFKLGLYKEFSLKEIIIMLIFGVR